MWWYDFPKKMFRDHQYWRWHFFCCNWMIVYQLHPNWYMLYCSNIANQHDEKHNSIHDCFRMQCNIMNMIITVLNVWNLVYIFSWHKNNFCWHVWDVTLIYGLKNLTLVLKKNVVFVTRIQKEKWTLFLFQKCVEMVGMKIR